MPRRQSRFFDAEERQALAWFVRLYLWPKRKWLMIVMALIIVQGLVYQQFLSVMEDGLRVIFENGSVRQLMLVCGAVLLVFAVRATASLVIPRLSAWIAGDAVFNIRKDLVNHLMTFDLAYFDRTPPGELILRLFNQPDGLGRFVGVATINAIRDLVTIIVIGGWLAYKQPVLLLTSLFVLPLILFTLQMTSNSIKRLQRSAENAFGAYISGIEEMVNGMRTVKIANQEDMERQRLLEATAGIRDLIVRLQTKQAYIQPALDVASALAFIVIIGWGGYMVLSPNFDLDGAELIAFLFGLILMFEPARTVSSYFTQMQASLIILRDLHALHLMSPQITDAPEAEVDFDPNADIVLKDVTFSYPEGAPLFDGLDLTIEGGKTTAIVGSTGSGKTTVLSLICRLYDISSGAITIGGKDIKGLRIRALRSAFSVVAQDIVVFNKSIWDNIRYVNPDATDDQIWAAAEAAEIADLMRRRGEEPVGPKGAQLSGGQKQRIAIARALLREAPIVILDEATSALDQQTEERIQRALGRLTSQKTTISVTHRLSSAVNADKIYVLESGALVESGRHEDLLKHGKLYAKMFGAQKDSYANKA